MNHFHADIIAEMLKLGFSQLEKGFVINYNDDVITLNHQRYKLLVEVNTPDSMVWKTIDPTFPIAVRVLNDLKWPVQMQMLVGNVVEILKLQLADNINKDHAVKLLKVLS